MAEQLRKVFELADVHATVRRVCLSATLLVAAVPILLAAGFHEVDQAELELAADGKCEYQVVLPGTFPSPTIARCVEQTARLVQAAF